MEPASPSRPTFSSPQGSRRNSQLAYSRRKSLQLGMSSRIKEEIDALAPQVLLYQSMADEEKHVERTERAYRLLQAQPSTIIRPETPLALPSPDDVLARIRSRSRSRSRATSVERPERPTTALIAAIQSSTQSPQQPHRSRSLPRSAKSASSSSSAPANRSNSRSSSRHTSKERQSTRVVTPISPNSSLLRPTSAHLNRISARDRNEYEIDDQTDELPQSGRRSVDVPVSQISDLWVSSLRSQSASPVSRPTSPPSRPLSPQSRPTSPPPPQISTPMTPQSTRSEPSHQQSQSHQPPRSTAPVDPLPSDNAVITQQPQQSVLAVVESAVAPPPTSQIDEKTQPQASKEGRVAELVKVFEPSEQQQSTASEPATPSSNSPQKPMTDALVQSLLERLGVLDERLSKVNSVLDLAARPVPSSTFRQAVLNQINSQQDMASRQLSLVRDFLQANASYMIPEDIASRWTASEAATIAALQRCSTVMAELNSTGESI